jgi:hypothetical protein
MWIIFGHKFEVTNQTKFVLIQSIVLKWEFLHNHTII